jgi:hypothetical protein
MWCFGGGDELQFADPFHRSNEVVVRGSKAMTIVYEMSSRAPKFIESSHLEAAEGT